jgi:tetratricopeptide (TPR) repeat protein
MEDFDQAIRLNNKDAVTFCNRGYVNNLMQQYRRAIQDFDAALRLLPNQAATYNNRGFSYSRLKQYDQALKDYTQAITIDPKDAPAYDNRADLEDLMGRPEVAAHDRDTARMLRQQ